MENKPIVILQGHLDMVCEKNSDIDLDFLKDPIKIKIDGEGNLRWQKTFGGSYWDKAGDVIQTSDGGYLVACAGKSDDGNIPILYMHTKKRPL